MGNLANKKVLVTGALGQLGFASTKLFLEQGASVATTDVTSNDRMGELQQLIEQYGEERLFYKKADVTSEQEVEQLAHEIEERFGHLDGYLNTVYQSKYKPIPEYTVDDLIYTMKGSWISAFIIFQNMLPLIRKAGGGSVVNTSSTMSIHPAQKNAGYGSAKAALNYFTQCIAHDYGKERIRANSILPGFFHAEEHIATLSEETKEMIRGKCLLERTASAKEVADFAAYLLSDASSYITGGVLRVDGGYHMNNRY